MHESHNLSPGWRVFLRGDRWYVSFRWTKGANPIVRSVADSQEEAVRVLEDIKRCRDRSVPLRDVMSEFFGEGISPTITLADAVPLYLADAASEGRKTPKTLAGERPRLLRVAKLPWASKPLTDIDARDIEDWLFDLRHRENLSGPTLNRWASVVSAVFRWAGRRRIISKLFNPAREIERFDESSGREVFLTLSELEAWIASAPEHFAVMARFYARTGVRRDEARLLQWRSVDLERAIVRIEAELSKNHKARNLPMTGDLVEALRSLRSERTRESGKHPKGDEYVFEHKGAPWSTYSVRKAFKQTLETAGDSIDETKRSELWLHDIRHTVGAILASSGVPERVIAEFLGHKSLATTRIYAHLYPSTLGQVTRALSRPSAAEQPDRIADSMDWLVRVLYAFPPESDREEAA